MSLAITIEPKDGFRERFELYVDGILWRQLHRTIFGRKPRPPAAATLEEWEQSYKEWEYRSAKRYAIWRLSKQSYHSCTLSQMLRDRLVQEDTIARLIDELITQGVVDDDAWIAHFIRCQSKRYGPRKIEEKLRSKGIAVDKKELLKEAATADVISQLLNTRYRHKDLTQHKERDKVIAALMRKGFTYDQIKRTMMNNANLR